MARLQVSIEKDQYWKNGLERLYKRAKHYEELGLVSRQDRATLALSALSKLWVGWTPALIARSCQASLLAEAPVVIGLPLGYSVIQAEKDLVNFSKEPDLEPLAVPTLIIPESASEGGPKRTHYLVETCN